MNWKTVPESKRFSVVGAAAALGCTPETVYNLNRTTPILHVEGSPTGPDFGMYVTRRDIDVAAQVLATLRRPDAEIRYDPVALAPSRTVTARQAADRVRVSWTEIAYDLMTGRLRGWVPDIDHEPGLFVTEEDADVYGGKKRREAITVPGSVATDEAIPPFAQVVYGVLNNRVRDLDGWIDCHYSLLRPYTEPASVDYAETMQRLQTRNHLVIRKNDEPGGRNLYRLQHDAENAPGLVIWPHRLLK